MQIVADVGGIPGKDCRGFCKYCYFRKVKGTEPFGCKNCSLGKVGCDSCSSGVRESLKEFQLPFLVVSSVQSTLMLGNYRDQDLKVNISGGGDVSCYPHLFEIVSAFSDFGLPMHLGYTSGKGIDDAKMAEDLVSKEVNEVTFTVFSTNPEMRREWVNDKTPQESLKALQIFCETSQVHAASVIVPGVNDGEDLMQTCANLEDWGAKAFILMRFANFSNQGLILGNEPILEGLTPHGLDEFEALVRKIDNEFSFKVTGTPICDPGNDSPFAISKDKNSEYLDILTKVVSEATILTSKIAAPYIENVIEKIEAEDLVNVVAVDQDIGCLITQKDLEEVDFDQLKETVIIPGRAFVHDKVAEEILSRDGVNRIVARGPDKLTVDGEMSGSLSPNDVLKTELIAFEDLIGAINFFGVRKN